MGNACIRLACCAFTWMFSFAAAGEEAPRFEPIAEEQYPGLVFVQEDTTADPSDRSSLMIATFDGDKPTVQKVMTSQYVKAVQLTDSVFLLEADQYPKDHLQWMQSHFLVNFQTGSHVLLSRSKSRDKLVHLWCLRSVPDKNEAVILRYGQGTDKSTLIHVDLKTLETTPRYALPRTNAARGFHGPHMKISPDLRLLAAMIGREQQVPRTASRSSSFSLRVLDLETSKATELDDKVTVEISPVSSFAGGTPPFEWISAQDILYQHMIPEDVDEGRFRHEAQYVLKCANVKSTTTSEWQRKRLSLTLDGGNMCRDWLTAELRYHDFTVDTRSRSLLRYHPCHSVKLSPEGKEIWFRGKLLHDHKGRHAYVRRCASRSQEHFAFFVRSDDNTDTPTVYAKTKNMRQLVKVAEVPFYTTLVSWIEDTSTLRKKQPNNGMKSDE
ncbi:MAG: hypothetical protein ACYTG0_42145 [Planctomycetota bacterium]